MIRQTNIVAETQDKKLAISLVYDDKNKPGQNAGQLASISNRFFESLMEFFNANELKVVDYCKEIVTKPTPKKKGAKK